MSVEEQVVSIFAGVRGYLDNVPVDKITRFEQEFMGEIKARHAGILDSIRTSKEISADVEKQLQGVLGDFVKKFS